MKQELPGIDRIGFSFMEWLTLLFIALKLTHFIDWSWWLVLLPFYWPVAGWVVVFVFSLLMMAVSKLVDKAYNFY